MVLRDKQFGYGIQTFNQVVTGSIPVRLTNKIMGLGDLPNPFVVLSWEIVGTRDGDVM